MQLVEAKLRTDVQLSRNNMIQTTTVYGFMGTETFQECILNLAMRSSCGGKTGSSSVGKNGTSSSSGSPLDTEGEVGGV